MLLAYISMTVLMITGIFLMIIILLQRGRGGGLAGAFGGLGGQSAFGTKAGDVFTKITVGLAVFWVVLAGLSGLALESAATDRSKSLSSDTAVGPKETGAGGVGADDEGSNEPINLDPGSKAGEVPKTGDAEKTPENTSEKTDGAAGDAPLPEKSTPESTEGAEGASSNGGESAGGGSGPTVPAEEPKGDKSGENK